MKTLMKIRSAAMKMKKLFSVFLLCSTVLTAGCASLCPPASDQASLGQDQQAEKKPTSEEEGYWYLLYYVIYGVGSAFSGK